MLAYGAVLAAAVLLYWSANWDVDHSVSALLVTGAYPLDFAPKGDAVDQPIEFPHRHHVHDVGLDCTFCHSNAEKGAYATIPNVETCSACHVRQQTDGSPEEAKLREQYVKPGKTIPWNRLYRVPGDVYFSHERHVAVGGVECQECHGPIDQFDEPPSRPLRDLTMEFCLDCHVESGQTQDCLLCHR